MADYSGPESMSRNSSRFSSTTSAERWVDGGEKVIANLNREIAKIIGNIQNKGMREVVTLVRREAEIITPVKEGNLIGSYSTDVYKEGDKIIGEIKVGGGEESYAIYVHEMPDDYNFTKPGSGPKFLERPLFENTSKILEILKDSAKI